MVQPPATNWARLVPRTPPEGLWDWAAGIGRRSDDDGSLGTFGLVYEKVYVPDESVDGMLGERAGRKIPMVRCTCSACGEEMLLNYVPASHVADGASYGFTTSECQGVAVVTSGDAALCPVCETPVLVKCMSKIPARETCTGAPAYMTAETMVMSAALLPGEPGARPLVLTGWSCRRYCSKLGRDIRKIIPAEAYVFLPDGGCVYLVGWRTNYSGTCGYFRSFTLHWSQRERGWRESWGECDDIFGLTEDMVEESCCRNSAFYEYMTKERMLRHSTPVPYLRLWQQHPNVENLVRQGAAGLLGELMAEKMVNHRWEVNKTGLVELPEIDWEAARPSRMLGLDRDEFEMLTRRRGGVFLWRLYVGCKRAGDRLTEDDVENAFRFGDEDVLNLVGKAPMGKTLRYLLRQIEECAERSYEDYMDEYGEAYDPELYEYIDANANDLISAQFLSDYWRMAAAAGWNLADPDVRWPKNLTAAHDRANEAYELRRNREISKRIRARYDELSIYFFAADGILLRPCKTQTELKNEGAKLHHCVGTYAKDVAGGEKSIFFIRREDAPKTPWFTLDFDIDKVKINQNRGKRNCAPPEEVEAFVTLWFAWVKAGCRRYKNGAPVLPARKKERKTA